MTTSTRDDGVAPIEHPEFSAAAIAWIFDHLADPILLTRPHDKVLRVNKAATNLLRMTEADLGDRPGIELVVDKELRTELVNERERNGLARREMLLRRGDGTVFLAEVTTALIRSGAEVLSFFMLRDLSDRERATNAFRESEQRYAAIYDKAPVPIILIKLSSGEIVNVNPAFLSLFEYELHEVVGKTPVDLRVNPSPELVALAQTFRREGNLRNVKLVRQTRSGKKLVLLFSVERISFDREPHALAIAIDITALENTKQALRVNEERLSLFVQQAPTSIAVFDHDMRYLAHSRRFLADFYLPSESVVGRSHYDVFPDLPEEFRAVHRRCLAGASERSDETPLVLRDGTIEWYRWEMVPWYDSRGTIGGVVFFSERITELKKARERIANQERLFADVIDGSPSFIVAYDRDGRTIFANATFANLLQKKKEELVGAAVSEYFPQISTTNFMRRHTEVMNTGLPLIAEGKMPVAGGELSVLAARYPLRDIAGQTYGTASIITDITPQKQIEAELRKSEEKAREAFVELEKALEITRRTEEKFWHAQRMEAIGRLAGGIAHDFNNLLTVILGNSSELLEELEPDDPFHEVIGEIEKAGQRAADLTRQLLAFSRKQVLENRVVNVNELILGAEKMFQRIIGEDVELNLSLDSRPLWCKVDKGKFEQVLLNLVVNSRDAMVDGGRLTIETGSALLNARRIEEHPDAKPGEYVHITVTDTGIGIPKDAQPHIFEPFFTTKGIGQGTGLGLSTAYGIIRQSGGTIEFHSDAGQGTTFEIYLPKQENLGTENQPHSMRYLRNRGKETILLVEDEQQVRNTLSTILRRAGYHVITAANGGEALLICEQHEKSIDLLLTDVVMPKLNGRKLAERLQQVRPEMRVLFMSGYTDNVVGHHGILDGSVNFIAKPMTTDALLTKVRETLDR